MRGSSAAGATRSGLAALVIAWTVASSAGCGTGSSAIDHTDEPVPSQVLGPGSGYRVPEDSDIQTYFRALQDRSEAMARIVLSDRLVEYLPNQKFVVNGGPARAVSGGAVVGDVVEVSPGAAFVTSRDTVDLGTEVDFDDPRAAYRFARVRIAVERWLAPGPAPDVVDVAAFVPHPAGPLGDAEVGALRRLGRVIVVLAATDRRYDWGPEVRVIAGSGVLLGDTDERGRIGFPGLGPDSSAFVGGTTVGGLTTAWQRKPPPITVREDDNGVLTRP